MAECDRERIFHDGGGGGHGGRGGGDLVMDDGGPAASAFEYAVMTLEGDMGEERWCLEEERASEKVPEHGGEVTLVEQQAWEKVLDCCVGTEGHFWKQVHGEEEESFWRKLHYGRCGAKGHFWVHGGCYGVEGYCWKKVHGDCCGLEGDFLKVHDTAEGSFWN